MHRCRMMSTLSDVYRQLDSRTKIAAGFKDLVNRVFQYLGLRSRRGGIVQKPFLTCKPRAVSSAPTCLIVNL
jgi:hypothetical protein